MSWRSSQNTNFRILTNTVQLKCQMCAGSSAKFDATSSYAQDFDLKAYHATESCKPGSKLVSTGKFDATSSYAVSMTYRSEHLPHSIRSSL